jgi:hypothetical protein
MANEFVAKNGLISQNNSTVSGSLTVTQGITGSLQGTASYAMSGGGGGAPGGSNTQIQFNGNNTFSGSSALTFNSGSNTLTLTGSLNTSGSTFSIIANTISFRPLGAGSPWTWLNSGLDFGPDGGTTYYVRNTTSGIGLKAGSGLNGTNRFIVNTDGSSWALGTLTVGSGTNVTSAVLNVDSLSKGFLPPRLNTTQKNAITSPVAGLVVYDTTLYKLCVYTGAAWETITST